MGVEDARSAMAETQALGVIGVGQMGGALVRGLVRAGALAPAQLAVCDVDSARAAALAKETGVRLAASNAELVRQSEYVALVVKPGMVAGVGKEIAGELRSEE